MTVTRQVGVSQNEPPEERSGLSGDVLLGTPASAPVSTLRSPENDMQLN